MSFTHTYFFQIKYICTVKKYVIYVLPPRNTRNHISSLGCNRPRMRFFHNCVPADVVRMGTGSNSSINNTKQELMIYVAISEIHIQRTALHRSAFKTHKCKTYPLDWDCRYKGLVHKTRQRCCANARRACISAEKRR